MPLIQFTKSFPHVEIPMGTNLMRALQEAGRPVASSCNGDGVCAKCTVKVLQGQENMSPEKETEAFLRQRHAIPKDERLSCQVRVLGDVTVDTGYW